MAPLGTAVSGERVYVADTYNHRVQIFDVHGRPLSAFGTPGSKDGQFNAPYDIAVDGQGHVYVADTDNHRVQKFTSDGAYLTQWGEEGSGEGEFKRPSGIAVDGQGHVYVADSGNDRVQKLTSQGSYLTQWGSEGSGDGQFVFPHGIVVDGQRHVYVTDTNNHRVQKFAADYPTPDPVHGLALNGSFEEAPDLVHWAYGGELPVTLVPTSTQGLRAARLGAPVPQTDQPRGMAWLRQTMYIRPEWERPLVSFRYRMFVNDIIDDSDLHVSLTQTDGSWLAEVRQDGFRSCQGNVAPPAGYDLGWRAASYDLSPFKGRNVRLVFENRNLHDTSWGIWTVVDDVRVVDAGPLPDVPLPGPYRYYFPLAMSSPSCDPVVTGLQVEAALRPSRP